MFDTLHFRRLLMPVALFCLVVALSDSGTAADWTRFRGPNGTGVSDDKNVPVSWSDKNILFKTKLPGVAHSSPIIVGNKIFLLSATQKERLVLCYDAETGKEIWTKSVPGDVGKTHRLSSLASATPCSDGERVYCSFWDGKNVSLSAYDLDGKQVWHRDLGSFKSQHGPGFSPMLIDGKVIINNDQDGKSTLQAFDAKTGKPAWEAKRLAERACYSTPFVHEQAVGGKQLIVTSTTGVTGYNPADGKVIWNYSWSFSGMPLRTVGSSVISQGMVYACSGDGKGDRTMIAVKLGGKGELPKESREWTLTKGTPYVPTILAKGDHLYTVTDQGMAVCREAKTGKEMWSARLGGPVYASPLLIDGKVYSFGERGDVTVFAANPERFESLATNDVGEGIMATPAVANGKLYIRGMKHLICVGDPGRKK